MSQTTADEWIKRGDYRDDAACHDVMCSYQAELEARLQQIETLKAELQSLKDSTAPRGVNFHVDSGSRMDGLKT